MQFNQIPSHISIFPIQFDPIQFSTLQVDFNAIQVKSSQFQLQLIYIRFTEVQPITIDSDLILSNSIVSHPIHPNLFNRIQFHSRTRNRILFKSVRHNQVKPIHSNSNQFRSNPIPIQINAYINSMDFNSRWLYPMQPMSSQST